MVADRAEDLVINDTHAASSIDPITVNITIDELDRIFP